MRGGECGGGGGSGYSGRDLRSVSYFLVGRIQGRIPLNSWEEEKARQRTESVIVTEKEIEKWERERERERGKERVDRAERKRRESEKARKKRKRRITKLLAVLPRHFVALSKASLQMLPATTAIFTPTFSFRVSAAARASAHATHT